MIGKGQKDRFVFTPDIDEIIENNYPKVGGTKCAENISIMVGISLTRAQVAGRARVLGVKREKGYESALYNASEERRAAIAERDRWVKLMLHMPAVSLGIRNL